MKKLLAIVSVALFSLGTASAESFGESFHLGANLGIGSTGITIDVAATATDYLGVRAGIDIMPKFKYKTTIGIDGYNQRQNEYNKVRTDYPQLGLPNVTFPSDVDVEGKLNNTTGHFLIDVYPGKDIDFHLTLGAYFGSKEVVDVYTTNDKQLLGVYTYNNSTERANAGFPKIGAQLGDFFLEPDANGHIDADIKVAGFRPYVGLGWGRAVPKNHTLGFSVDLGCQFWGKPKVYCQGTQLTADDVDGKDGGAMKVISKIAVYPTLTFRLTGKFF